MSARKTKETYVLEANIVHNNRYDYSKTIYVGNKAKIEISCPIHGDFMQIAKDHLRGSGCPKCTKGTKLVTKEDYVNKANTKHDNFYNYDALIYRTATQKVDIDCPVHGVFQQKANLHLKGTGCPKCKSEKQEIQRLKLQQQYIEEANEKHNGEYCYEKTIYVNSHSKLVITCKHHGDFIKTASYHLKGGGCRKCMDFKQGGYGKSDFIRRANGRVCTFYTLRCFSKYEEFYKIGITSRTVKERYSNTKKMPYNYELISEVKGSADFIWDLEVLEKRKLKGLRYHPKKSFKGSKTECFTNYKI